MDAERWRRIDSLLEAALDRPIEERGAYLVTACGDDLDLRREIESLLASDRDDSFLARPASAEAARLLDGDQESSLVGQRFGRFDVVARLGEGGMGVVYLAQDLELQRRVALKFPGAVLQDNKVRERLLREARAAAALQHPAVCRVFELGQVDGRDFIVMEHLEGETLGDRLAHGPIEVAQALAWGASIAAALEEAHDRGLVHRDLKPGNVMVLPSGQIKVMDFGLARPLPAGASGESGGLADATATTDAGSMLGTPGYMAPEQLRGDPTDRRVDVWALGCVLYQMLAGERAFPGATAAEAMAATKEREPDWERLPPDTPEGVLRLLVRCLTKDPRNRLRHAGDVRLVLEEAQGEPGKRPARSIRRRALTGLVVGVAVLVAAALWVALWTPRHGAERPAIVAARFNVTLPEGVVPARFPMTSALALSPDGGQLAIAAVTRGRPMLWVRPLDGLESTLLEGTEGVASPFWSPEGREIAFFAAGKLKKIAVSGGQVEVLCDAPFGSAGTWGPNGTVLFTEWAGGRAGLYRVSAAGGAAQAIALRTATGPEVGIAWPRFLPGEQRFVYLSGAYDRGPRRMIALASLDSPEARHLAPADSQPIPLAGNRLLFVREGRVLAQAWDPRLARMQGEPIQVVELVWFLKPGGSAEFTASSDGSVLAFRRPPGASRLMWLDRGGRELGTIGAPGFIDTPRLSPDGTRVAFEVADPRAGGRDIWVHDLVRGVRSRVTLDPLDAALPVWSGDGTRLLFGSASQGGPLQMRVKRADASGAEEELLRTDGAQIPQDWSPDGRSILFADYSPSRRAPRQLWLLPLDGERRPRALESSPFSSYDGRFSPDGRWVAFVSEETGRPEVFITPVRGSGRRQQVSAEGGLSPRWRRDGREIFFLSAEHGVMAAALGDASTPEAARPRELFVTRSWQGWASGGTGAKFDVDARGERFLFALGPPEPSPIVVAIGWGGSPGQPPTAAPPSW